MFTFRRSAAVAVALLLLVPAAASAHQGNPNYESLYKGLSPKVPGLHLQVLGYDNQYELINKTGKPVTVLGYEGEPYARVLTDGTVEVNQRSPATYLNEDRYGTTPVPASANPKAPPVWKVEDKTGRFSWHDHRMHFMSKGLPNQVKNKHAKTKIFDYHIPMLVGGQRVVLNGTLFWRGTPKGFPLGALVSLVIVAVVALGGIAAVRRRRRAPATAAADAEPGPRTKEAW